VQADWPVIFTIQEMVRDGDSVVLEGFTHLNPVFRPGMGEFGRTVGQLSAAQGRDHHLQQFAMVGGPLCVCGRHRSDHLFGGGDRLDYRAPRRSAGARLRVRADHGTIPVRAGRRIVRVGNLRFISRG
jgi:hypothetical protein